MIVKIFTIYFLLNILTSCTESNEMTTEVSACAKKLNNGDIIECDNESESNLDKISMFLNDLDKTNPGPSIPNVHDYHTAVRVNEKGVIELKNGDKIAFAGMKCNHPDLKKYLKAFFIKDKETKVVYLPTGYKEDNLIFAYVWEVSPTVEKEYKQRGWNNFGNPTHETALFSQWCYPIVQDGDKFHERFIKIREFIEAQ